MSIKRNSVENGQLEIIYMTNIALIGSLRETIMELVGTPLNERQCCEHQFTYSRLHLQQPSVNNHTDFKIFAIKGFLCMYNNNGFF